MCCFSGPVRSVSNTNIFARLSGRGTQFLVYSMQYSADSPVAMILPLPVAESAKRAGIRFLNFKPYSDFFPNLDAGFPSRARSITLGRAVTDAAAAPLPVESAGDFIASYVPGLDDFGRLDPRFRLPRSVWDKIPVYADYGFAVFQLKENVGGGRGAPGVHPMAFEFPTRFAGTLYFPTVHIHDGQVHPAEGFDHLLYLQDPHLQPGGQPEVSGPVTLARANGFFGRGGQVRTSDHVASRFVDSSRAQGVVDGDGVCYKLALDGRLPNQDTLVKVG